MVMKKLLLLSVFLGVLLTETINSYFPGNILINSSREAVSNLIGTGTHELASIAFGGLVEYFIVILLVYFFLRSVLNRFER